MREILFRAQKIDTKEWVYGHYTYMYSKDKHFIYAGSKWCEVLKDTLCQYTGITDKNGKKIFEGDILSAHFDENFPENETREVVVWDFCSFKLEYKKGIYDELAEDDCLLWAVIGNIHDNPELIKI